MCANCATIYYCALDLSAKVQTRRALIDEWHQQALEEVLCIEYYHPGGRRSDSANGDAFNLHDAVLRATDPVCASAAPG